MATATRMGQLDLLQFALANFLVFNKIKKTAGLDHIVLGISGGGKLSKEVCIFIRALGIQLSEGYGLTETSPVINFNEPEFSGSYDPSKAGWFGNKMIGLTMELMITKQAKGLSPYTNPLRSLGLSLAYNTVAHKLQIKPGTVGKPVLWTEEKIAEDGEILVKGPRFSKDTGIYLKQQRKHLLKTAGLKPAISVNLIKKDSLQLPTAKRTLCHLGWQECSSASYRTCYYS